jgi:cobalt-precorrin 5A hydrolase/precorrin-3B C17-methyltransferase
VSPETNGGKVYFIGAGPGDPELITLRGKRLIESADLVLYADSLVRPDISRFVRQEAELIGTADQTLEDIVDKMVTACRAGRVVARVHSGDPSLYGALHEQIAVLEREAIPYEMVPGVSSAFAAAAELRAELTVPEVSQTVIFTRLPSRTPSVAGERLRDMAAHGATMAIFLSVTAVERVVAELRAGGYAADTPAAVVYRATWPDQRILRGVLDDIAGLVRRARLKRQALIMVGRALDPAIRQVERDRRSGLYSPSHGHVFRPSAVRPADQQGDLPKPHRVRALSAPSAVNGAGASRQLGAFDGPIALIAASADGARLARRLAQSWPMAQKHVLDRYLTQAGPNARELPPPLSAVIGQLFKQFRGLVFFLPVGAVVRLSAPFLEDKRTDPAVVAVDDGGRFAVSVLAGHAGGANLLAERVAAALGAQPVVTTSVERRGQIAPELIGLRFGWRLTATREALLRVSAVLASEEPLWIYDRGVHENWLPAHTPVRRFRSVEAALRSRAATGIIVTDRRLQDLNSERFVVWRPRKLVAGVGCSAGAPPQEIEALLRACATEAGHAVEAIGVLATLDRKIYESGLVDVANRLGLELRGYTSRELAEVAVPNPSEDVDRAVGTPSVAEAGALRAANARRLTLPKRRSAHATVAIARTTAGSFPRWSRRLRPDWRRQT